MIINYTNYKYGLEKPQELSIIGQSVVENKGIYSAVENDITIWYASSRVEYTLSEFLSEKVKSIFSLSEEHDELIAEILETQQ